MKNNKLNINKTKYRYFKDNFELFPMRNTLIYTIPVDKSPKQIDGHLNRDYPCVKISNIKFIKMVEKVADALVGLGVKKGDFVTICQSNTPEAFYLDYALSKIGAIPSYVYPTVTSEEMVHYINEVDSKFVFVLDEPEIRKMVSTSLKMCGKEKNVKMVTSSVIESFPEVFKKIAAKQTKSSEINKDNGISWEEFLKMGKGIKSVEVPYEKNAICSLMRTSGTSSMPKPVMDSNENVNAVVSNYEKDGIVYKKGNKLLQTIPLFVAYGKSTSHVMFCNGVGMILIPEMNPKNFSDLILKFKPDYAFATPSHGEELMKDNRIEDLSFFKIVGFGGDGFNALEDRMNSFLNQHKALNQLGEPTFACNGYGSTEVSAVAISNSEVYHRIGTLGKVVGDTKAGIFDPDTLEPLKDGEEGELAITGPTVTLGYYNDEEETKKVYKMHPDGNIWVHMGDLAYKDEDGYYHYSGRIKNIIARKSFKFSPKEIVDAILLHPNVSDCVVVAKYDKEEGQVPSAHITLNDYSDIEKNMDEIINLVNENVQAFHRPKMYKITDKIVKTRNNKNNFNALRIEDIAITYPGVIATNISLINDTIYDYKLDIVISGVVDSEGEESVINYIKKIIEEQKVPTSNILYNVVGVKYIDSESYYKQNNCKIYVKEI